MGEPLRGSATARARLRIWVSVVAMIVCASMPAVTPPHARAATDAAYRVESFPCGGRRGSGQTDALGNLYVPCQYENGVSRPHVAIFDANGVRVRTAYIGYYASDVAPSPDGAYLYTMNMTSKDLRRLDRQPNGAYLLDATWRPQPFPMWGGGSYTPLGEFVATDGQGNVYVSSGTWTSAPNAIVKYAPDGRFLTAFGDYQDTWTLGFFFWVNNGLAVTPDGASVYTAETGNNRIQRWDRQADSTYRSVTSIGNDPAIDASPRDGWCGDDDRQERLAAPYDVGLDRSGTVYTINATCYEVKRYSPAGVHLGTQLLPNPYGGHLHGLAVDGAGRVYVGESNSVMRPVGTATPAPQPQWIEPTYVGWALATSRPPATTIDAWRWTATGWAAASFPTATRIWVQPFSNPWMWAWREGIWYAVLARDVAR